MRRFLFYFLIALLTFGIGSIIVFKFYWKNNANSENQEKAKIVQKDSSAKITPAQSLTIKETEEYSPAFSKENDQLEKPFCRDKQILPVWNLITKDKYFLEQSGGLFRNPNCSDMFEILKIDFNKDGSKEILLRGKSSDLCGAVGNCGFWIFEKKGKNYRKILSDSDYVDITEMGEQITRRKTNGYYEILLKGHWNSSDTMHSTYKFNGQKYVESECLVNYYIRGSSPIPKWEFITCREHAKREGY